eukprot:SAG31_NODE_34352_length_334_cov_0.523404_1_plen_74_part_01
MHSGQYRARAVFPRGRYAPVVRPLLLEYLDQDEVQLGEVHLVVLQPRLVLRHADAEVDHVPAARRHATAECDAP